MRIGFLASIFLICYSLPSSAAFLRAIEGGPVAVDSGSGYVRTTSPRNLQPGDRVRASATGQAEIVYDNGCIQPIGPNQTAQVSAQPTCTADADFNNAAVVVGGVALVAGGIAIVASSQGGDDSPASP